MEKKIKVLGEIAEFDSSGYSEYVKKDNLLPFIYPAVGEKGRICNLFKILLSNYCISNCLYCINRKSRDCKRYKITPSYLAEAFYYLWKKNYVEGLFLSSAIDKDVNETQEKIIETAELLRKKYKYHGYIHLKILPGADPYLIKKARFFASRISLNMEAPSSNYLKNITLDKDFSKTLLKTLKYISSIHKERPFSSGITTQFVVGAGGEKDKDILNFSYYLYKNHNLTRIYYSGFKPILNTPLENLVPCKKERELRLYQADILIRKYGFSPSDFVFNSNGNLSLEKDPKLTWAEKNFSFFPIEINKANFEELIKVPGIGYNSAKKILEIRRENTIKDISQLKGLKIRYNICWKFLLFNGKIINPQFSSQLLENQLLLWEEL